MYYILVGIIVVLVLLNLYLKRELDKAQQIIFEMVKKTNHTR